MQYQTHPIAVADWIRHQYRFAGEPTFADHTHITKLKERTGWPEHVQADVVMLLFEACRLLEMSAEEARLLLGDEAWAYFQNQRSVRSSSSLPEESGTV